MATYTEYIEALYTFLGWVLAEHQLMQTGIAVLPPTG